MTQCSASPAVTHSLTHWGALDSTLSMGRVSAKGGGLVALTELRKSGSNTLRVYSLPGNQGHPLGGLPSRARAGASASFDSALSKLSLLR